MKGNNGFLWSAGYKVEPMLLILTYHTVHQDSQILFYDATTWTIIPQPVPLQGIGAFHVHTFEFSS